MWSIALVGFSGVSHGSEQLSSEPTRDTIDLMVKKSGTKKATAKAAKKEKATQKTARKEKKKATKAAKDDQDDDDLEDLEGILEKVHLSRSLSIGPFTLPMFTVDEARVGTGPYSNRGSRRGSPK